MTKDGSIPYNWWRMNSTWTTRWFIQFTMKIWERERLAESLLHTILQTSKNRLWSGKHNHHQGAKVTPAKIEDINSTCLWDLEHQISLSLYMFISVFHRTVCSLLLLLLHDVQHIKLQLLWTILHGVLYVIIWCIYSLMMTLQGLKHEQVLNF